MIKNSLTLMYDNISSDTMFVTQINVDSGLMSESFMHSRSIQEEKIRGRSKPYFLGIEEDVLRIPLSLWFKRGLSDEDVRKVARWLNQQYYKPLSFSESPNRIFYAMYDGSVEFLHNGIASGYIQLEMKCHDAYSYSPIYVSDEYECVESGTMIKFVNEGDIECTPIIYITKIGAGDVTIRNNSDGGKEMKFTELEDNEVLKVDCEEEEIESSLELLRYENHNDHYFSFPRGVNNLQVFGNCKIQSKYEFKILQG